jgi:hypothetical protein
MIAGMNAMTGYVRNYFLKFLISHKCNELIVSKSFRDCETPEVLLLITVSLSSQRWVPSMAR